LSQKIRIGLVQMAMSENPADNLACAVRWVEQLGEDGAEIVCLPELFRTRYFCQTQDERNFELAEPIPGPTTDRLGQAARRHGLTVLAPIFEQRAPGIYHNSVAMIGPQGEVLGLYRKMHIPHDPGFCEKYYFTPGDLGFRAFDTTVGRVGALI